MSAAPKLASWARLAVTLSVAAAFTACDRAMTAPDPERRAASSGESRRDIVGDSLGCRGGWVIIGGYYVCT